MDKETYEVGKKIIELKEINLNFSKIDKVNRVCNEYFIQNSIVYFAVIDKQRNFKGNINKAYTKGGTPLPLVDFVPTQHKIETISFLPIVPLLLLQSTCPL